MYYRTFGQAGLAAGALAGLLAANIASAQLPSLPPVPGTDAVSDAANTATDTAQDTANSATNTAQDAANTATNTAQDAARTTSDTASDAAKSATDTARDATKSATSTARDASKSATSTARDATKSATSTARDATKRATDTTRDAARSASDAARTTTKSATDTTRDAARTGTDAARDAARTGTDAARDAARSTTGAARDAQRRAGDAARDASRTTSDAVRDASSDVRDASTDIRSDAQDTADDLRDATRDASRDARDTVQDVRRDARDAARDTREEARDIRGDARGTIRDTREDARDVRQSTRETTDNVRSTVRDAAGAVVDEARDAVRSSLDVNAGSSVRNFNNYRSADLGLWFDRSVRDGLVIADVATDAALAQVGFMEGDRIVSINGQAVTAERDFIQTVLNPSLRERAEIIVLRDGQQETLYIDPVVIREQISVSRVDPLERFGVILDDRIDDRLVVWRVIPRSPAFYAGIRPGDEITTFAGERIAAPTQFVQTVERADPGMIPVEVTRNGRVRQLEVDYPQYEVSDRTTFRQDLDVDAGTYNDGSARRTTTSGRLNTNVDTDVRTPAGTVRGDVTTEGAIDATLPDVPNAGNIAPAPRSSAPSYRGNSGSAPRRGILRRGR